MDLSSYKEKKVKTEESLHFRDTVKTVNFICHLNLSLRPKIKVDPTVWF